VSTEAREPRFGAVVTAMVTPFDDAGALDVDAAVELARWLLDHGSDGLVVGGTTGEGTVLSDVERRDLWAAVAEAVTAPVVAGAGSNDTAHSVELARTATECGVDGLLLVTPYYNRPGQQGIFDHFATVASASHLPVMLYDIPVRTGRRIAPETTLRLIDAVPNLVGVKDSTGDVPGAARLVAQAPRSFQLYSGEDALTLPLLAVGAVGVVSVAAHWVGEDMASMVAAFHKGDVEGARLANARLLEAYRFESTEEWPNPLPTKAVLRALGLPVGQCRLPMGRAPAELDRRAGQLVRGLSLTVPAGRRVG
jgi:4-hydroxy-tetrahydrodipicolinate synthase